MSDESWEQDPENSTPEDGFQIQNSRLSLTGLNWAVLPEDTCFLVAA